jgi:toxin ParE1/3/4
MNVRLIAEARVEIIAVRDVLDEVSRDLGDRFEAELESAFHVIAERGAGYPTLETLPDGLPYRRLLLRKFRYAVVFFIDNHEAVVLAVVHTSRKPNYWLGRGQS